MHPIYKHELYRKGDENVPKGILDGNGDVALGLCKNCGAGEVQLDLPCTHSLQYAQQLSFAHLSEINRIRCESTNGFSHDLDDWTFSEWFMAFIGEVGEAANIGKKLLRIRDNIPGNHRTEMMSIDEHINEYEKQREIAAKYEQQLAEELADAVIYFDLMAQRKGINLAEAVVQKFNKTSAELGCDITLLPDLHVSNAKGPAEDPPKDQLVSLAVDIFGLDCEKTYDCLLRLGYENLTRVVKSAKFAAHYNRSFQRVLETLRQLHFANDPEVWNSANIRRLHKYYEDQLSSAVFSVDGAITNRVNFEPPETQSADKPAEPAETEPATRSLEYGEFTQPGDLYKDHAGQLVEFAPTGWKVTDHEIFRPLDNDTHDELGNDISLKAVIERQKRGGPYNYETVDEYRSGDLNPVFEFDRLVKAAENWLQHEGFQADQASAARIAVNKLGGRWKQLPAGTELQTHDRIWRASDQELIIKMITGSRNTAGKVLRGEIVFRQVK